MKNTRRQILIILLLTLRFGIYSQGLKEDKGVKWKFQYQPIHPPIGLVYQNELLFQIGQRIAFMKNWEAVSLCANVQMQRRENAWYFTPTILINYWKPIKYRIGPVVTLEYSYRKIQGLVCNTITPEIGFTTPLFVSINYGYNLFLDNKFTWTTYNRITLRWIVR
jgi:hypothetical protein